MANSSHEGLGSLMRRVEGLRAELAGMDPASVASRAGAAYRPAGAGACEIRFAVWGREVAVGVPGFVARDPATGKESDPGTQALTAYYLRTTDGSPEEGRWISFSELPDGAFYFRAFQGYTGEMLARVFGGDLAALARAAEKLGGRREAEGDLAFSFHALPRVPILLVCWRGDEEFPASAKLLFDGSAGRHLPTDVCAILGSTLTRRFIRAR
jgi:hypothetical protein